MKIFRQISLGKADCALYVGNMSRRKLVVNLAVIIMCGIVALSIPVIANHLPKTANADSRQVTLVSSLTTNDFYENALIWQIELRRGEKIIQTWDEIYQALNQHKATLNYDTQTLKLTAHGLVYTKTTKDNYSSVVTYQDYSCRLSLH